MAGTERTAARLIHAARTARRIGSTVYIYNAQGRPVWCFGALTLAVQYYTLPRAELLARYGFVWIPDEPYATMARHKLGGLDTI